MKFYDRKSFSKEQFGSYMVWTVSSIKKFKGYRRRFYIARSYLSWLTLVVIQFAISNNKSSSIGARVQSEIVVEKRKLNSAAGSCGFWYAIVYVPIVRLLAALDKTLQVAEFFELRGSRLIPRKEVNAAFAVQWICRPATLELYIKWWENAFFIRWIVPLWNYFPIIL